MIPWYSSTLLFAAPLLQIPTSFRFPLRLCALHLDIDIDSEFGFPSSDSTLPFLASLSLRSLASSTVSLKLPHPDSLLSYIYPHKTSLNTHSLSLTLTSLQ
jgi:hypothetical protein